MVACVDCHFCLEQGAANPTKGNCRRKSPRFSGLDGNKALILDGVWPEVELTSPGCGQGLTTATFNQMMAAKAVL